MKSRIVKANSLKESGTPERCFISELCNKPEDNRISIALARVKPKTKTQLHYLDGIDERYLIFAGKGRVEVDDIPPTEVEAGDLVIIPAGKNQLIENIGKTDLLFYC
ncbi:MAG: cupin domain-containing protein, partial [Candidatus Bathyarchaeota archaeon]|nr:cupin domain-containing protein [Candidatus Bathyarchaeum sp.]